MTRNANENQERDRKRTPGAMKPVSLTSMNLRPGPAREIAPANIEARDTEISSHSESTVPATAIDEHQYSFSPINEQRFDLRQETSIDHALQSMTITPMQMQELRERRIAARELGWVIPGHRIRIQS